MRDEAWLKRAMKRIKKIVSGYRGMRFSGENPAQARVQALLARGGEELFPFLEEAADIGLSAALRENGASANSIKLRRAIGIDRAASAVFAAAFASTA